MMRFNSLLDLISLNLPCKVPRRIELTSNIAKLIRVVKSSSDLRPQQFSQGLVRQLRGFSGSRSDNYELWDTILRNSIIRPQHLERSQPKSNKSQKNCLDLRSLISDTIANHCQIQCKRHSSIPSYLKSFVKQFPLSQPSIARYISIINRNAG